MGCTVSDRNKRGALISEGPSAALYPGGDRYAEVIGVNAVPTRWPCTWWAFADPEFYVWHLGSVMGRPRILTTRNLEIAINSGRLAARGLKRAFAEDRETGRLVMEDEVPLLPPMPRAVPILNAGPRAGQVRWSQYGGLVGLVAAWLAGVGELDVFGVDLEGRLDVHGVDGPGRIEDRWVRERELFGGLVRGFERAGDMIVNWAGKEAVNAGWM